MGILGIIKGINLFSLTALFVVVLLQKKKTHFTVYLSSLVELTDRITLTNSKCLLTSYIFI